MSNRRTLGDYALVTGGAGFVGANLAHRLLGQGERVVLLDNLARAGVERNVEWLQGEHGQALQLVRGDCRDAQLVKDLVRGARRVFHLAAQVAVTTSLVDPVDDFEVNARGTLNVLEALRARELPPPLVFTSTNKVYGALPDVALEKAGARYHPRSAELGARGVDERRPLDFHSPYGCSKGCADQYVLDYARTYGLPAVVFRMSCIYGPRQFGTEDQGWVAHFMLRALRGERITIYGDGLQVRDLLFVDDLVDAFLLAERDARSLAGHAFNIGGGPSSTCSLIELIERITALIGRTPDIEFQAGRVGDQRYYVSDTSRFRGAVGWAPRVSLEPGLARLHEWLKSLTGDQRRQPVAVRSAVEQGAS